MRKNEGNYLFTSESVSEGHPDKVCDQISDAILDEHLRRDCNARVAIETLATTQKIVLAGEVKSPKKLNSQDMIEIARQTVRNIGYEQNGFHWKNMEVDCYVHAQSEDISKLVDGKDRAEQQGAGDQGIMFGYATNETDSFMPATLYYSHLILKNLKAYRKADKNCGLLPDAKSQVTLEYKNGIPVKAHSIVVSTQHTADAKDKVKHHVMAVLKQTFPEDWLPHSENIFINHSGDFIIGGPDGDAGLTGRKIIVDTYGGAAPHGGGAFSGKDPSKVDRSAAYFARYLAKNVVAAELSSQCQIQLSYAIGKAEPLSFYVNTDRDINGTYNEKIKQAIENTIADMTPYGICKRLKLNNPIYQRTATYGHFGRTPESKDGIDYFTWEKTDLAEELQSKLQLAKIA